MQFTRIQLNRQRIGRHFWNGLPSVLLLCWSLIVLRLPWGSLAAPLWRDGLFAAIGWVLCAVSDGRRPWIERGLRSVPWLIAVPFAGKIWQGVLLWLNCVLTQWNNQHHAAVALFSASADKQSVVFVSMLAAAALGQLMWYIVIRRRLLCCGVLGGVLILLQMQTGTFAPVAWGLWCSAGLGLWMSDTGIYLPKQSRRIWVGCTAVLLLCALPGAGKELTAVTHLRESTKTVLHELRYGKETLPEGELSQAYKLGTGDRELLIVRTGQEKTLYLRAFVGADYQNGAWGPLPDAVYGGTYTGMLNWLHEQGFDPLSQSAAYYTLCDTESAPEKNTLYICVTGGSREYLYLPASAETVSARHGEKRDLRMTPRGLFGEHEYTAEEYSSVRPAELTVWADWVASAENEEQQRYAQAEAIYRSFVYDSYTAPDNTLEPLLNEMFWKNYRTENDGVYSAVDHIRSVLGRQTIYTCDAAQLAHGPNALVKFLKGEQGGNAVLYATAAVEALRAKGIPARYVEGYYVSESDIQASANGTVSLSGQNSHAWAEVYFDGVGWLPVDVTPGYYYDAITLRQMISLPDTAKKTAALESDTDGGADAAMESGLWEKHPPIKAVLNTVLLLMGMTAVLAMLLAGLLAAGRLVMVLSRWIKCLRYRRADAAGKTRLLARWIYAALAAQGIEACLGWETAKTDAEVAHRFAVIQAGEYTRMVALLEKFSYGGAGLEAFELRALQAFLRKVYTAENRVLHHLRRVLHLLHRKYRQQKKSAFAGK